VLASIW